MNNEAIITNIGLLVLTDLLQRNAIDKELFEYAKTKILTRQVKCNSSDELKKSA